MTLGIFTLGHSSPRSIFWHSHSFPHPTYQKKALNPWAIMSVFHPWHSETTNVLSVLYICLFWTCLRWDKGVYGPLSFPLSTIHSRLSHVVAWISTSLIFKVQYSPFWLYQILLMESSVHTQIRFMLELLEHCYHEPLCAHLHVNLLSFLLGMNPEVEPWSTGHF